MPDLHLISFEICPFVQRSVIALEEKGAPYRVSYIDLADKPSWFLELSPLGKVPVLRVDDETTLFESAVIAEYIDEVTPGSLHPADPLERAVHRGWIEMASSLNVDAHGVMVAGEESGWHGACANVRGKLARYEERLGDGPFFAGERFSLVDAATAPPLQRLTWCEEVMSSEVFDGLPKVSAWRDALLARPSVQRSTVDDIRARFEAYLQGGGSPARHVAPSWLGRRLG